MAMSKVVESFEAIVKFTPQSTMRMDGDVHTVHTNETLIRPLVRCKDCKWFCEFCDKYKQESRKDGMCEHPKFGRYTLDTTFDYYCADGERR